MSERTMQRMQTNVHSRYPLQTLAWYAIVTKYRHEKSVAKLLGRIGIETFIPLQKVVRKYNSGKKTFEIPLISCYVFTQMNIREHVKVLEMPGVLGFVKFCNEIVEVPEEALELMKRVNRGEYPVEVLDHNINAGDEVEVVSGSLRGVKGRLVKINNKKRFVISIDNIGRSFSIEMHARMLKPLKGRLIHTKVHVI